MFGELTVAQNLTFVQQVVDDVLVLDRAIATLGGDALECHLPVLAGVG